MSNITNIRNKASLYLASCAVVVNFKSKSDKRYIYFSNIMLNPGDSVIVMAANRPAVVEVEKVALLNISGSVEGVSKDINLFAEYAYGWVVQRVDYTVYDDIQTELSKIQKILEEQREEGQ